jgi:hypothetical protein
METPILALGREFLSNGWVSQTDRSLATGLLSWKISRLFKRFELLEFVEVEKELRFTRGRPRKLRRLTQSGIKYFTGLLGSDENRVESRASRQPVTTREGELDG